MYTIERTNKILALVNEKSFVTVAELKEVLGVSEVTIRKLLNDMDHQGLLKRARGGAVSCTAALPEFAEHEKEKKNITEKKAIAKAAYELIEDDETVFLDAGSTTMELGKLIRNGNKRKIVVVTNAFNIANEMLDAVDIEVVFTGGYIRHKIMSCVGGITENTIASMCYDKAFIGANSISMQMGATTPNLYEAQVKQKVMECTKQSVLLCDSSKMGLTSMAKICPLSKFDIMISDSKLKGLSRDQIKELGINLIIAD